MFKCLLDCSIFDKNYKHPFSFDKRRIGRLNFAVHEFEFHELFSVLKLAVLKFPFRVKWNMYFISVVSDCRFKSKFRSWTWTMFIHKITINSLNTFLCF